MEYEKETSKKTFDFEASRSFNKFNSYNPNNTFNQFTINKRKNTIISFNNKTAYSLDRNNPFNSKGQKLLSNQNKEWSNLDFKNNGNIYEKLNLCRPFEKDNLLMEIYYTNKDINRTIKEIKDLKKILDNMEEENLANKFMITQLLNKNKKIKIESNNNFNDNINIIDNNNTPLENNKTISYKSENKENKENNEKKFSTLHASQSEKSKKYLIKNRSFKNKNKTNTNNVKKWKNKIVDIEQSKINVLMDGLAFYKKLLNSKEKELNSFKKKKEIKEYNQLNDIIENKNKELEELIKNYNDIQYRINETDDKILNMSQKINNMKENEYKKKSAISFY